MIPNHDHLFESVRGMGLMLGIKMKTDSRAFVNHLREHGLLTVAAGDNVMRVLPPLVDRGGAYHRIRRAPVRSRRASTRCPAAAHASPSNTLRSRGRSLNPIFGAMPARCTCSNRDVAHSASRFRARDARGRLARLGPVLDTILSAHDYPPAIARLLAEALTLTALLGAMLKDAGGPAHAPGADRERRRRPARRATIAAASCAAMSASIPERLAEQPGRTRRSFALFGKGYLAITFDQAVGDERYQGIVPLEGDSLAAGGAELFRASPSRFRASSGSRSTKRDGHGSPAASCSSICPRARRAASGCTRGSTIPNGTHVAVLGRTVGRRADRSGAAARDADLAAVPRGGRGAPAVVRCRSPSGCRCDPDYVAA